MLPKEEWRMCVDFPGYEVSSIGRVRKVEAAHAYDRAAFAAWGEYAFLNFPIKEATE